ncbi:HNH endonuclease domain-containing protein [Psychromonas marina]|uniref:HNH endonuclease domain-containing protein n=1 Tax=Psychromonas marina TaxID=88364 RepID=UPI0024E107F9|nr:HNH endonuclease domain-containing protein [Psychromonas marina]
MEINSQNLVCNMLTHAWFPAVHFKLNLGSQDMILNTLASLNLTQVNIANSKGSPYLKVFSEVKQVLTDDVNNQLLTYVPYRLLQPFFHNELKGKPDQKKNAITAELSITRFQTDKPLYKIEQCTNKKSLKLTLHPEWFEYLNNNLIIIKSWVELNWLQYLQTKNPNSPAISNKLCLPSKREALTNQRAFWNELLKQESMACIFSNANLTTQNYELDHFIPWTYVAHNQYWNLLPILDAVNSSKSNHLPAKGKTVDQYVDAHYRAIILANKLQKEKIIDDYILVLQCSESDLFNHSVFKERFTRMLETLIDSAALQGFQTSWIWKRPKQHTNTCIKTHHATT